MSDPRVIEVIRRFGEHECTPAAIVEAVIARLLPAVRLIPMHPHEAPADRSGTSRIGGTPDLPAGAEWPTAAGWPLQFLLQIDLAEVSPCDVERVLPEDGLLLFFFTPDFEPQSRVLLVQHDDLRPTDAPSELPPHEIYQPFKLTPRTEWTVPSPYDLGFDEAHMRDHLRLWNRLEEEVALAQGFGPYYEPRHQLLGHPQLIQSPGLADGTRLLVQVDSDCVFRDKFYPRTNMMWGDAGRVYYLIEEGALKSHRLETAEAMWECC